MALPLPLPFCVLLHAVALLFVRGVTLCSATLSFAPRLGNSAFLCRSSFCCVARHAAAFLFKSRGFFLCRGAGMCRALALATALRVVPQRWRLHSMAWRLRLASCRGVFLRVAAFFVVPRRFSSCCVGLCFVPGHFTLTPGELLWQHFIKRKIKKIN